MEKLLNELRFKLATILDLDEIGPEDIGEDDSLIGGKFAIDSIDLLEMVMMIDADYGIKINNRKLGEKVFKNLRALTKYIHQYSPRFAK